MHSSEQVYSLALRHARTQKGSATRARLISVWLARLAGVWRASYRASSPSRSRSLDLGLGLELELELEKASKEKYLSRCFSHPILLRSDHSDHSNLLLARLPETSLGRSLARSQVSLAMRFGGITKSLACSPLLSIC